MNLEKPYLIKEHVQYINKNKSQVHKLYRFKKKKALQYFNQKNLNNFIESI